MIAGRKASCRWVERARPFYEARDANLSTKARTKGISSTYRSAGLDVSLCRNHPNFACSHAGPHRHRRGISLHVRAASFLSGRMFVASAVLSLSTAGGPPVRRSDEKKRKIHRETGRQGDISTLSLALLRGSTLSSHPPEGRQEDREGSERRHFQLSTTPMSRYVDVRRRTALASRAAVSLHVRAASFLSGRMFVASAVRFGGSKVRLARRVSRSDDEKKEDSQGTAGGPPVRRSDEKKRKIHRETGRQGDISTLSLALLRGSTLSSHQPEGFTGRQEDREGSERRHFQLSTTPMTPQPARLWRRYVVVRLRRRDVHRLRERERERCSRARLKARKSGPTCTLLRLC